MEIKVNNFKNVIKYFVLGIIALCPVGAGILLRETLQTINQQLLLFFGV